MRMETDMGTDQDTASYRQNVEEHNKEMAQTEKSQLKYQKLSFVMSMLSAIFTGTVLIIVICLAAYVVPKVNTVYNSTRGCGQNPGHFDI